MLSLAHDGRTATGSGRWRGVRVYRVRLVRGRVPLRGVLHFRGEGAVMVSDERVKRAVVRLESSSEGSFAREEVEEGVALREVINSYDLTFQDIEDLRAIQTFMDK